MALLEYSEIRQGKIIIHEDEPCTVLENHVARTQQRKPQNQVKLKSLLSGRTWNVTYHAADKAEEADMSKRDVKFLYASKGEYWFCDPATPANRFKLDEKLLGESKRFFKDNCPCVALVFGEDEDEQIVSVKLPVKMEFIIKEAPPAIKGSTMSGGNKVATLDNGATVNVPLFIEAGEKILVNTDTGEYSERVQKEK